MSSNELLKFHNKLPKNQLSGEKRSETLSKLFKTGITNLRNKLINQTSGNYNNLVIYKKHVSLDYKLML